MNKDFKLMIGALAFTFLVVIGLSLLMSGKGNTDPEVLGDVEGVTVIPNNEDWGDIPINGGIVTKEFSVENTTNENLEVRKIVTSCMCTQASIDIDGNQSRFFGMEHPGDKNPPINMELPAGKTAKVTVNFDPAAHGPQGAGPFERTIWLTFTDPAGVSEINFNGTVVN